MCEYCEKIMNGQPVNVTSSFEHLGMLGELETYLQLSKFEGIYYIGAYSNFKSTGESFGEGTRIIYCPFCGQKLTEMED